MIRAGDLRHKVMLQSPSVTQSDSGQPTKVWEDVTPTWVSITPITAREVAFAQSFSGTVNHKIGMRYRRDIDRTWRIVYGNRTFDINGIVDPDGRQRELVVYATEVA